MFSARNKLTGEITYIDDVDFDAEYVCPICGGPLIIKNGQIQTPHFAHKTKTFCDTFSDDMSEWHKWWQSQFPKANREHIETLDIKLDDYLKASYKYHFYRGSFCDWIDNYKSDDIFTLKHRADVRANGYVIEFQHNPISLEEFNERNWFYQAIGCKIIWVFDLTQETEDSRIQWYDETDTCTKWSWKNPKKMFRDFIPQNYKKNLHSTNKKDNIIVFFQTGEITEEEGIGYMERVSWAKPMKKGLPYSDFSRFCTECSISTAKELKTAVKSKSI